MKKNEKWKTVKTTRFAEYQVSDAGRCKKILRDKSGTVEITNGCLNERIGYRCFAGNYVHRLVALAFVPNLNGFNEVDHINSDRTDNRACNLRWVTHKENVSTEHSREARRLHAPGCNNHGSLVVKATKGEQTLFFVNGRECARFIGCSSVLVYNVINYKSSAKLAKGWALEWVGAGCPEAEELIKRVQSEKAEKLALKSAKREAEINARLIAKAAKKAQKLADAEALKNERKREKAEKAAAGLALDIEKRIAIWTRHAAALEGIGGERLEKIRKKIEALMKMKQKIGA